MITVQEISKFITDDAGSQRKRNAKVGVNYYEARHDILDYKLFYYDGNGNIKEDTFKSNIKISHPFFTEIVDQQVQYMLSKTDSVLSAEDPFLNEQLRKYFNSKFWTSAHDMLTGTITKGFDYMYAYTDKEGNTRFDYADGMGVIEITEKDSSDHEAYVIYWYVETNKRTDEQTKRVQVWSKDEIYFYTMEEGGALKPDDQEEKNPRKHAYYKTEDGKTYGKGFGFIPFFRLDNGRKQTSGLKPIKAIIDDYDLMSCSLSNNLQDFNDAIYVVKGYPGDDLNELIQNIKTKKHIGVDSDGDIDVKTINIPHEARKTKMEINEKNIYRFGMAFNSAQTGDGNITNIVIKSRYALLDLKCNKLELRLKEFLEALLEVVIDEINKHHGKAYKVTDVTISFEREIMTNASDNAEIELKEAQRKQIEVDILLNISNVIPEEKVIQLICEILDIDFEKIKDQLPVNQQQENQTAQSIIDGVVVDE